MKYLIFDTETSGFPRKRPLTDKTQPRILQLAWLLFDKSGEEYTVLDKCAKYVRTPPGFTIDPAAAAVHGITPLKLQSEGVAPLMALSAFAKAFQAANGYIVGHKLQFDLKMLEITCAQHKVAYDNFKFNGTFCTMLASVDICKLTGRYGKYKLPKLTEAYAHIIGKEMENAHDALGDVLATFEVYKALGTKVREANWKLMGV